MEKETPSQVLIATLESFAESEPTEILVLYISEDGNFNYKSNTDSAVIKLGLIEFGKKLIMDKTFNRGE